LVPGIPDGAEFIEPLDIVKLTLHYSFLFGVVAGVYECFKQIRRLIHVRRNPAMPPAL
jgi:hypothetical protein